MANRVPVAPQLVLDLGLPHRPEHRLVSAAEQQVAQAGGHEDRGVENGDGPNDCLRARG
jgi:hypothetical protein